MNDCDHPLVVALWRCLRTTSFPQDWAFSCLMPDCHAYGIAPSDEAEIVKVDRRTYKLVSVTGRARAKLIANAYVDPDQGQLAAQDEAQGREEALEDKP